MWELIDIETNTRASEVPGVGVLVGVPGMGVTMVYGARLFRGRIMREDRDTPPLAPHVSAAEIRERAIPDPGAAQYFVMHDEEDSDY